MKRFILDMPVVLVAALACVSVGSAQVAMAGPCDIYGSGGTACVAAHSTTRALFSAYSGRLYQVKRASDGAVTDVGTLAAGGYANAATQDAFCANTTCTITIIYDQTTRNNHLTISPAGGAGSADVGAVANALPITAGGHAVYGVYVAAGVGYRNLAATGTARNGQAEGMYMVASGTHVNDGCCFDYGNTEQPLANDVGNGYMDAVYLGNRCEHPPCTGTGPWIAADLENGLFAGNGSNTANQPVPYNFVTAINKTNGQTTFALRTGNAQSGGLTTQYSGTLPNGSFSGYIPLKQQGGIVMGVGGDNSKWSTGSFFEGAMTIGQPSDATENSVHSNIVAAGYSGDSNGGAPNTITGPATKCVDVAGDDVGVNATAVQLWDCQGTAADQRYTYNADQSLGTLGRCLDIVGNGTANGALIELWDCNGVGGQKWVQQADGSLLNPQSGRCLDSPNGATANGTRLQIWDCNGSAAQKFKLHLPVAAPTPTATTPAATATATPAGTAVPVVSGSTYTVTNQTSGKCVDAATSGTVNGTHVQQYTCNATAAQQWIYTATDSGYFRVATKNAATQVWDVTAAGTADGALVQLSASTGATSQQWLPAVVSGPYYRFTARHTGKCLDVPSASTADGGAQLQQWTCNASGAQSFSLKLVSAATPTSTPTPTPTTRATATATTRATATATARATATATTPATTNLALGRPATASSVEAAGFEANLAVDGNTATRWSTAFSDPQWIRVDLGAARAVSRVTLRWEAAFGKSYQIQTSNDAVTWTSIYTTTTSDGGVDDLTGLAGNGRYVRMYGTARGTAWGYSLWELEVY